MSETLFRFLLSEVETLRLKCLDCGQTMELSLDRLGPVFRQGMCPLCGHTFAAIPHYGHLANQLDSLATALRALQTQKELELSFTFAGKTP